MTGPRGPSLQVRPLLVCTLFIILSVTGQTTSSGAVLRRDCRSDSTTHNTYTCRKNISSGITEEITCATWLVDGREDFNRTLFLVYVLGGHGILIVNINAKVDTIACILQLKSGRNLTSVEYHPATDDNCPNPTPVITSTTARSGTFTSSTFNNESKVTGMGSNVALTSNSTTIEATLTIQGTGMHKPPTKPRNLSLLGILGVFVLGIIAAVVAIPTLIHCIKKRKTSPITREYSCAEGGTSGSTIDTEELELAEKGMMPTTSTDVNPLPHPHISMKTDATVIPADEPRVDVNCVRKEQPKSKYNRDSEMGAIISFVGSGGNTDPINGEEDLKQFLATYPSLEKSPDQEDIILLPPGTN